MQSVDICIILIYLQLFHQVKCLTRAPFVARPLRSNSPTTSICCTIAMRSRTCVQLVAEPSRSSQHCTTMKGSTVARSPSSARRAVRRILGINQLINCSITNLTIPQENASDSAYHTWFTEGFTMERCPTNAPPVPRVSATKFPRGRTNAQPSHQDRWCDSRESSYRNCCKTQT